MKKIKSFVSQITSVDVLLTSAMITYIIFLIYSLKYADASKLAPFGYIEIIPNLILGYYFFNDFPSYF